VTYKDTIDGQLHYVLLKGEIKEQEPTLVRVHLQSTFNDILLSASICEPTPTVRDVPLNLRGVTFSPASAAANAFTVASSSSVL
ncbi:hypothetical protein PSH43_20240, partial [Pseudoalteromonas sp. CST1]|nr:hypothetical protein [Pseudoalteromonas sp. CST1]